MHRTLTTALASLAAIGAAGGVALAAGGSSSSVTPSRLDDGRSLLPQAKITEAQAIAAAQQSAAGALNEVDLEHYQGRLVFNVDIGAKDVKVDATSGQVVGGEDGSGD
jgi:uncharacterized membrane protein YkoI